MVFSKTLARAWCKMHLQKAFYEVFRILLLGYNPHGKALADHSDF